MCSKVYLRKSHGYVHAHRYLVGSVSPSFFFVSIIGKCKFRNLLWDSKFADDGEKNSLKFFIFSKTSLGFISNYWQSSKNFIFDFLLILLPVA